MKRFRAHPTSATVSAVLLVLVAIIVGAAGINGLLTVQSSLDEVTATRVPALTSLFVTEQYIDLVPQEMSTALFGDSSKERIQASRLMEAERVSASHMFQQYLSNVAAGNHSQTEALSALAQQRFAAWMSATQQVTRIAGSGVQAPDSKAYPVRNLEQQTVLQLHAAIAPLIQANQDAVQAADARGAASHKQAIAELLAVMASTILGAVLLQSRVAARERAFRALSAQLRRREEYFRSLVQNSSDVVTVMAADTTIQYQTPSVSRICGYAPDETAGRPFMDLLHTDDIPHAQAFFAELIGHPGVSTPIGWRMRHHDGWWLDVETIGVNLLEDPSVLAIVLNSRDVTERKRLEVQLKHQAMHDPLTDLLNYGAMVEVLNRDLARARRQGHPCALLFLDIDHFKALNDTCGHQTGDVVLRAVATLLTSSLRASDTIGRWGGEEFVAVLADTDLAGAMLVAERIRLTVASTVFAAACDYHATCSIGVSMYPRDGQTRDEVIAAADRAMYAAKRLGRNQVREASETALLTLESVVGATDR